ncbi:MAG: threonylcarbamoyl-AMP synthase [Anaerolineae bacterium]|nr:threonylcarbamoyl-AMP synthase [Anaerolineae bacterium]
MTNVATRILPVDPNAPEAGLIDEAAAIIRAGGLVAFPTETVYGLGANALDAEAVSGIFRAKGRPTSDPVIVHLAEREQLGTIVTEIPSLAWALAEAFWPGPLTLVLRRSTAVPGNVSAGRPTVAVRMPAHPVAHALITAACLPVAAPSANTFSRPSATTAQHVWDDLHERIALILDGGPAPLGVESTVLDLTGPLPVILRPGGVTLDDLVAVAPDVIIRHQYLAIDATAASPGQLIKHYSPRAEMLLFDGPTALEAMRRAALERLSSGQRPGLLLMDDEAAAFASVGAEIELLGASVEQAAARLFAALRALDSRCGVILAHGLPREGLGAAVWDRMVRAAEGRVIAAP